MAKAKFAIRRSHPGVPRARYEALVSASRGARRKAKEAAQERMGAIVGGAVGFGVGTLEKRGTPLPRVMGLEPTAAWGMAFAFGPEIFGIKGKVGRAISEGGAALLGIAGYKFGLGQPVIAGDDYTE